MKGGGPADEPKVVEERYKRGYRILEPAHANTGPLLPRSYSSLEKPYLDP